MSTKKLAKELGLLRKRSQSAAGSDQLLGSNQVFPYLIVIDFESTCWREKNNYGQEIIEFPAVLLNTSTGAIESEFHAYVQPQEHPVLSSFCTELTGITQMQVEAGVPLQICLSRFSRWLQTLQLQKGVVFGSTPSDSKKPCAFLTWSDWDLGVCLQYECKRKQLHKPGVLNSWIDLRATYRLFYNRKPKGLNGALKDLGIQFSGREHSGLDDSRNTAQLAARMIRDGCVMKITRTQERMPLMAKPLFGNGNAHASNMEEKVNLDKVKKDLPKNKISTSKSPKNTNLLLDTKDNKNVVQEPFHGCQSLISPRTLLNGKMMPRLGRGSIGSLKGRTTTNLFSPVLVNAQSPRNDTKSLVLCSTTVERLSHLHPFHGTSEPEATVEHAEAEDLIAEMEGGCGSYDHVVLDNDDNATCDFSEETRIIGIEDPSIGNRQSSLSEEPKYINSDRLQTNSISNNKLTKMLCTQSTTKTQNPQTSDSSSMSIYTIKNRSHSIVPLNKATLNPNVLLPIASLAVRKSVTSDSKKSKSPYHNTRTSNSFSPIRPKAQVPERPPGSNMLVKTKSMVIKRNTTATCSERHSGNEKASFIYNDTPEHSKTLTHPAPSSLQLTYRGGFPKITSPLCGCGRRAKRQTVGNGGPNHGRGFFCCPVRRSSTGTKIRKGCDFFKWESALIQARSLANTTVLSAISLNISRQPVPSRKSY